MEAVRGDHTVATPGQTLIAAPLLKTRAPATSRAGAARGSTGKLARLNSLSRNACRPRIKPTRLDHTSWWHALGVGCEMERAAGHAMPCMRMAAGARAESRRRCSSRQSSWKSTPQAARYSSRRGRSGPRHRAEISHPYAQSHKAVQAACAAPLAPKQRQHARIHMRTICRWAGVISRWLPPSPLSRAPPDQNRRTYNSGVHSARAAGSASPHTRRGAPHGVRHNGLWPVAGRRDTRSPALGMQRRQHRRRRAAARTAAARARTPRHHWRRPARVLRHGPRVELM